MVITEHGNGELPGIKRPDLTVPGGGEWDRQAPIMGGFAFAETAHSQPWLGDGLHDRPEFESLLQPGRLRSAPPVGEWREPLILSRAVSYVGAHAQAAICLATICG